jgi:exodeoxyribonuclease VII small subunit
MESSPESTAPPEASCQDASGGANFEQTLTRLEEIVHLLEDGKIGLDDALQRYEEGVGLLRGAYDMLQRAERKIELLTGLDSDGNPILRPMEDAASFSLARDATAEGPRPPDRDKVVARGRRRGEPEKS